MYLLTLSIWLGSVIFFSFIVAPTIFKTLEPQDAAQVIRRIFSKYYIIGILCAASGIVCVGFLLGRDVFRTLPAILSLLLLAGMGGVDFWLRQAVMPEMNGLRQKMYEEKDPDKKGNADLEKAWKSLHRTSVQLNVAVLLCCLVLLYVVVSTLTP